MNDVVVEKSTLVTSGEGKERWMMMKLGVMKTSGGEEVLVGDGKGGDGGVGVGDYGGGEKVVVVVVKKL
jgi:hypothetical protein